MRRAPEHAKLRILVVARTAWSAENEFLTPTMRIRRSRIEAAVADQVSDGFAREESVIWA
jgi:long-subunit acyl-CoA synthetase (AMP-forming)